jgi:branched-subunit amino acid permease
LATQLVFAVVFMEVAMRIVAMAQDLLGTVAVFMTVAVAMAVAVAVFMTVVPQLSLVEQKEKHQPNQQSHEQGMGPGFAFESFRQQMQK